MPVSHPALYSIDKGEKVKSQDISNMQARKDQANLIAKESDRLTKYLGVSRSKQQRGI